MNKRVRVVILICLFIGLFCIGYLRYIGVEEPNIENANKTNKVQNSSKNNEKTTEEESSQQSEKILSEEEPERQKENYKEVNISAVGDIMVHDSQLDAQYDELKDTYDFNNNFTYVKEYIDRADIALANFEGTLAGKENVFSGYPVFNAPDTILDAIKNCGFDILGTANNHTIDKGSNGVIRTYEQIKNRNLKVIGTKGSIEQEEFIIENVNGIKMGFISYTFETPRKGKNKTLNAIEIPKKVLGLINTFSYEHLDEDLPKMENNIKLMKEKGAEAIVFFIHWGTEYARKPSWYQKHIAQQLSNYGVDIILGCHPHVVQPIEFIKSEIDNKKTLVAYSMGNFLSNQQYERTENRYTEDGIIVNVKIKKDIDSGKVIINEASYIPTWVHRFNENENFDNRNEFVYEILPLFDALDNPKKYSLELEEDLLRAKESMKHTVELMEPEKELVKEPSINSTSIPVSKGEN